MVTLISGKAVLPQAQASDIYLTALGGAAHRGLHGGLVFRPQRQVLRMGVDSLVVLVAVRRGHRRTGGAGLTGIAVAGAACQDGSHAVAARPPGDPARRGYDRRESVGIVGGRGDAVMTAVHPRVSTPAHVFVEPVGRRRRAGSVVVSWVTTTDHKKIANLYFVSSFVYFLFGGLLALLIRAELVTPGLQVVENPEQYNQLFTMHGTIMLLLFATPLFAGFANALMPIQIGAPDVAFPRLNMFAYWMYLFGGLIAGADT